MTVAGTCSYISRMEFLVVEGDPSVTLSALGAATAQRPAGSTFCVWRSAGAGRSTTTNLAAQPCDGTSGLPCGSAVVRSPKFVSFILTLGGVVPPGASRDYFVARQNLAGLDIGQSLDPTVPRGEIDPREFE
jgi:hypothetical protein